MVAKMDPHPMDPLVSSQQRLFTQVKRSHRIFMAQMYVGLLIMPLFALFFLVFGLSLYQTDVFPKLSVSSPLIGLIVVPIVGVIWQIQKYYSFARSSVRYFNEIEHSTDPSQLTIGLTSYVNHLVNLMHPQILLDRKRPATLSESLKTLESRLNKQIYAVIAIVVGLGLFLFNLRFFFTRSGLPIHPLLYVILAGLFSAYAILLWLTFKWRPLAKQWIQGFYALIAWGENLEQLFLSQKKGGRDL